MKHIIIDIANQQLDLYQQNAIIASYQISSAVKGLGERYGSECTPRGKHIVSAKIGAGAKPNSVFVARRQTGEIYSPALGKIFPQKDWILSRILWLSGTEKGKNRLGQTDTLRRYIYIHGTPDTVTLGRPGSCGCIRMHNIDVIALFDQVSIGTPVNIVANSARL